MPQLLQSVFQTLQLHIGKIPILDRADDSLHHVLTDIIGAVHIIEIVVMLIFYEMIGEAFKYFQQDGYSFDKIALA